jgi:hypothetical protein
MQVGKLYKLTEYFFFLYKSKADAEDVYISCEISATTAKRTCIAYDNEITFTYLNADSLVMCLDVFLIKNQSRIYKVLTCEGEVGWIMIHEWGNPYCTGQSIVDESV